MVNIVTWNINGIRSSKQDVKALLDSLEADIICFQETKITRDMLDEKTALVEGYTSYYSFCRKRAGYSGVATYCKSTCTPYKAEEGLTGILNSNGDSIGCYDHVHSNFTDDDLKDIDAEGRCMITLHKLKEGSADVHLVIVNVYCPNAGENDERLPYKLKFFNALELRCQDFIKCGYRVVVLGDLNVSHRLIDHCEPEDVENFSKTPSRIWMENFLGGENRKFVDSFRELHPNEEKAFTCWNTKINARVNNYGTRIDYVLLSSNLAPALRDCSLMKDVYGSDHCPVKARLEVEAMPSSKPPSICTQYYKEFSGKQLKISAYVSKRSLTSESEVCESQQTKKMRLTEKKTKQQQSSLLSFFGQPKNIKSQKANTREAEVSVGTASFDAQLKAIAVFNGGPPSNHRIEERITNDDETTFSKTVCTNESASTWKSLFKGPPPPPVCSGHKEPSVLRTVKKKGPNMNRQFWACARPAGHSSDKNAQCNFFMWVSTKR